MRHPLWIEILVVIALCIGGAVIIPNLRESRPCAPEAAAATALKSGVYPAEIQFQAAAYRDDNHNGIGEFGFFTALSGLAPVHDPVTGGTIALNLLAPTYQFTTPLISDYHFVLYLPNGPTAAITDVYPGPDTGDPGKATLRESHWIAYAWPDHDLGHHDRGHDLFAIDQSGVVYRHNFPAKPKGDLQPMHPAFNALYTRDPTPANPRPTPGTWLSPISPDWQLYRR
jgi:hypothetical protein